VIRLLNRQRAGRAIDPEEAYEVMAGMESVILGDVDTCRAKIERYREIGVDRLMCLMQFGALPHARVMQSLRLTGEHLVHAF
jgi:alkanesulfonate monooxygenase SsuD/methylene tetrahydromethanopterin reductase-like flavin-dependent oxidoreductase (luciferase family)